MSGLAIFLKRPWRVRLPGLSRPIEHLNAATGAATGERLVDRANLHDLHQTELLPGAAHPANGVHGLCKRPVEIERNVRAACWLPGTQARQPPGLLGAAGTGGEGISGEKGKGSTGHGNAHLAAILGELTTGGPSATR